MSKVEVYVTWFILPPHTLVNYDYIRREMQALILNTR